MYWLSTFYKACTPPKKHLLFKGGVHSSLFFDFQYFTPKKRQACTPPLAKLSRKKLWTRKTRRTRKLLYGSKQLLTDNNYSQGLNVKEIKMLSLCLPFMGFACGKSLLMRVLLFSGKPFEASQENEPPPSRSHYGKTKYGDKIAPCGRKKSCSEKETDWALRS